jgi:hypothetical protein
MSCRGNLEGGVPTEPPRPPHPYQIISGSTWASHHAAPLWEEVPPVTVIDPRCWPDLARIWHTTEAMTYLSGRRVPLDHPHSGRWQGLLELCQVALADFQDIRLAADTNAHYGGRMPPGTVVYLFLSAYGTRGTPRIPR